MWEIGPKDKVVYLYAHPMNILLGFHKKINTNYDTLANGNPHYAWYLECDVGIDFNDNFIHQDVLNLEKHLDRWWRPNQMNVMCVKYEKLFENEERLYDFLETPPNERISFGEYIPRSTDWTASPHHEQLKKTYETLIKKYEEKPDYEIFRP